ncbi:MAG TPA: helix-turn-helix domain-containing protein [Pontiella sp.]
MQQGSLNIGTIGQKLEAARKAKGVTVSEAGKDTKIISRFITAMEEDKFEALGALVYAKGFIKMYAQYLGLDAEPLLEEYITKHISGKKPHRAEVQSTMVRSPSERSKNEKLPRIGRDKIIPVMVEKSISLIPDFGIPFKLLALAVGSFLLVGVVVLSATQCSDNEEDVPVADGAAYLERGVITDGIPDAYLVAPGVVELNTK